MSSEERLSQNTSAPLPSRPWGQDPLLLPVCCICGLVREEASSASADPRWMTFKHYCNEHERQAADVLFTHTYCPDCLIQVQERVKQYFNEQRARS